MPDHDIVDYLALARQRNASDLHITAGAPPTARIFGTLQPLTEQPLTGGEVRDLVLGILRESQRAQLEHEWELDFSLQVEELGRFRANACFAAGGLTANFRFIPQVVADLAELGHSPTVEEWCRATAGLVLVTGASGSGKSTTLASMTQTIARQRCANIVSIEDPVEFVFPQGTSLIHQREVGTDAKGFAAALRNALRQDANVIVLGELRDEETIHTALTAADTGHLVIGTLHTTDSASAVSRIMNAYAPEQQRFVGSQLAASLLGVVCQHLLPKRDTAGLVLASEIMVVNTGIATCIRDGRLSQIPGLIQIGGADGMHTVDDSLLELTLDKRISLPDALSYCSNQEYFRQMHQQALQQKKRQSWFGRFMAG
jgi:twitching motility protein PilT